MVNYDIGFEHLRAGKLRQALEVFNTTPEKNDVKFRYFENKRQYGIARVFCQQAQMHVSREESIALLKSAETKLLSILETTSNFTAARICLGRIYEMEGKNDLAIKVYEQGLIDTPRDQRLMDCLNYLNRQILESSSSGFTPLKRRYDDKEEQPDFRHCVSNKRKASLR